MSRKSKTQLFKDLAEIDPERFSDAPVKQLEHPHIGDETYGKDSHIYVGAGAGKRALLERELLKRGHKLKLSYNPGSDTVDVQVTYFKGWHWDE